MRDTLAGGAMACSARGAGEPACQEERAEVAAEPRTLVAVLELRLGARLGCGTGERERERALEEADVVVAARNKAVAATWLDRFRRGAEDAAEDAVVAVVAAGEPAAVGAADPPEPAVPITVEMPSTMESSSVASIVS